MKIYILNLICLTLTLTACKRGPDDFELKVPPRTETPQAETIASIFGEPGDLLKSTEAQAQKNKIAISFQGTEKDSRYFFPFYFNSENYSKILVKSPTVEAVGCDKSLVRPLELSFGMSPSGFPIFGFDPGHNPKAPEIIAAYDTEEDLGAQPSENTITIMFFIPAGCEKVEIEFEVRFR